MLKVVSVKFLYFMITVVPLLNASHPIQFRHKGRGVKLHDLEGRIETNLWTHGKNHCNYLLWGRYFEDLQAFCFYLRFY